MAIAQQNYEHVRQVLYNRAAIVLNGDKLYLVESRLLPIAKRAGVANVDALVERIRLMPTSPWVQEIIDAMTTNETSFNRDVIPFQILRNQVLPELIERRKVPKTLRLWSAGCSSGQEPYSLAMLWQESFTHYSDWQFRVFATDISNQMLERAKSGIFSDVEVKRGLSPHSLNRFFRPVNGQWQIDPNLKNLIEFRFLNLIDAWPATLKMDIVFLRNVLVYFDLETKQSIFKRLRNVLAPDGYLFLGGAETTLMIDDAFERVSAEGGSFYRLVP